MFDYDKAKHDSSGRTESAIESARVGLLLGVDPAEIHGDLVKRGFSAEQAHFVIVAGNMLIKGGR